MFFNAIYVSKNFLIEIILPQAPMLTPIARKMQIRFPARYPAGTSGEDKIIIACVPIIDTILLYRRYVIPAETSDAKIPMRIPSPRNGPLMNQFVAPTYFIIEISRDLAKTVNLMVLDTTTTDTTIRNAMITSAAI